MVVALPSLGALRDWIRSRFGKRGLEDLERALRTGDAEAIRDLAARPFVASAVLGYYAEQELLELADLSPDLARAIAEAAGLFAQEVAHRAALAVRALPAGVMPQFADLVLTQGLAQGFELGTARAAAAAPADVPLVKTWVRIHALKNPKDARPWHEALEGSAIDDEEMFRLPGGPNAGALVKGPHDWDSVDDPAEWMNCQHGMIYTPAPPDES